MGNKFASSATEIVGYKVISVEPLSPGFDSRLIVNEDYIIKLNNRKLSQFEPDEVMSFVKVYTEI